MNTFSRLAIVLAFSISSSFPYIQNKYTHINGCVVGSNLKKSYLILLSKNTVTEKDYLIALALCKQSVKEIQDFETYVKGYLYPTDTTKRSWLEYVQGIKEELAPYKLCVDCFASIVAHCESKQNNKNLRHETYLTARCNTVPST